MQKLETLTIRILPSLLKTPLSLNTNGILKIISNAKFKNTLKRFKLIEAQLESTAFERLIKSLKNLESLQLIDCVLYKKDSDRIVQTITKMNKLEELVIEINNFDNDNCNYRNFSLHNLQLILINCNNLDYFNLETVWTQKQTNILKDIAGNKNINCKISSDYFSDN